MDGSNELPEIAAGVAGDNIPPVYVALRTVFSSLRPAKSERILSKAEAEAEAGAAIGDDLVGFVMGCEVLGVTPSEAEAGTGWLSCWIAESNLGLVIFSF